MSTSPKRLAVLASAALAFAGLTVLAPPAQAASHRSGDQRGLRRRRWHRCHLQRRLRRAGQPDRRPDQRRWALHPLPVGDRRIGRHAVRTHRFGAGQRALPDPDEQHGGRRRRAAVARHRAGRLQHGRRRGAGVPARQQHPDHDQRQHGRRRRHRRHGRLDHGSTSFETAAATAPPRRPSRCSAPPPTPTTTAPSSPSRTPTPENTFAGGGDAPVARTIAEIQGDGFVSPDAGLNVTVRGVVTAGLRERRAVAASTCRPRAAAAEVDPRTR